MQKVFATVMIIIAGIRAGVSYAANLNATNRKDQAMYGYIAIVIPRPAGGYRLEFPNLPGCRAAAASVEDALGRAERSLRSYAGEMTRQGLSLPQPRPSWAMVSETERYDAVAAACVAPPRLPIDMEVDAPETSDTVDATDELFESVLRVFSAKR